MTSTSCGGGKYRFECICPSDDIVCNENWGSSLTTVDIDLGDWETSWDEDWDEDWNDAADAAATAIVTVMILSFAGPIVGFTICCVACCYCNKTCCFERKMNPIPIAPPQPK